MILSLIAAQAATVHQCEGTLTGPWENTVTLRGFGANEKDAAHAAEQSARLLGTQRILVAVTDTWLGQKTHGLDPVLTLKGTRELAVAGHTWATGTCSTFEVEEGLSYKLEWTPGAEQVHRVTPATALEAARRRTCVPMFQRAMSEALHELANSADRTKLDALDQAAAATEQCMSGPTPTVAPATEPFLDTVGPTRCTAIDNDGSGVARGFGPTAEQAAEQALRQSVLNRMLRAISGMAKAQESAPESKMSEMTGHLGSLTAMMGTGDAIDRARLACATVKPTPIVWRPEGRRLKFCNQSSWMERPVGEVIGKKAASFVDHTCRMQIAPTFEIVRFAARSADPVRKASMLRGAMQVSTDCASACYADATWGAEPTPITLHGAPARLEKKAVVESLLPLTEGSSLIGLELLPTLQSPKKVGLLITGQLGEQLATEMATLEGQAERWTQIDGNWILSL